MKSNKSTSNINFAVSKCGNVTLTSAKTPSQKAPVSDSLLKVVLGGTSYKYTLMGKKHTDQVKKSRQKLK
jgi:hypothetical protein